MEQSHVVAYSDTAVFLADCRHCMDSDQEGGLILGLVTEAVQGKRWSVIHLWAILEGDRICAAAMCTPPYRLLVTSATDLQLLALCRHLQMEDMSFPGVSGPLESASVFASIWVHMVPNIQLEFLRAEGVHSMRREDFRPPPPTDAGALRVCTESDFPLLKEMLAGFSTECRVEPVEDDYIRRLIENRVAVFWEDVPKGEIRALPVSTCFHTRECGESVNVCGVYTPPRYRGQRFASQCVAAKAAELFQRFSLLRLFTDMGNPTTNSIYQRLGWKRDGFFASIVFHPKESDVAA
eukprot:gnl/Trimastix_PCT/3984.p1 GENE.gnl/Trimastix_PCT/3984~~gnl/Trimastix_PCT/3984.p1  ORF type:complete len:294 (-),score=44.13 gnl/Trimastix_PCT/3984:8-889(-)